MAFCVLLRLGMDFGFHLGSCFGFTFGSWMHHLSDCFSKVCFCTFLTACGAVWNELWMCLGRHWGSFEPFKIRLKCTTIHISRVWTLLVQRLFRDLILERVRHAFLKIWDPIWASSGIPFGANGGGVEGYRCHVFLMLSRILPNPKPAMCRW